MAYYLYQIAQKHYVPLKRTKHFLEHFKISALRYAVFSPGESMNRGAWRAAVHRVAKSRTRLSDVACIVYQVREMQSKINP